MRTVAIGRRDGVDEQRLLRGIELRDVLEAGVQCEHAVELRRLGKVLRQHAALRGEGGIADRSDGGEAVGRAALDDEDEAPVGRRLRKGEARREAERERSCSSGSDEVAA